MLCKWAGNGPKAVPLCFEAPIRIVSKWLCEVMNRNKMRSNCYRAFLFARASVPGEIKQFIMQPMCDPWRNKRDKT